MLATPISNVERRRSSSGTRSDPELGVSPSSSVERLVWLDCDPGHDDAFAIILAGYSDSLCLLGISTVGGNQTVEKTTKNCLKVLAVSGLTDVDVVPGLANPLARPNLLCPEIHGETGLDGPSFPHDLHSAIKDKAVLHMAKVIALQDKPVTVVATGRLSNIALLITLFPELKDQVDEIVFMGGAIGHGNTSPCAEFNIEGDPEAASIVVNSGWKVVMVPLEVTHTVLVTPQIVSRVDAIGTPYSDLLKKLLLFFGSTYKDVFGMDDPPLHDPAAVAYVIDRELFDTELMRVDIECGSQLCAGQTVCDIFHRSSKTKNVRLARKVNVAKLWELMFDAIEQANAKSSLNIDV